MFTPFEKLKNSLAKTKDNLMGKISRVVLRRKIDDDLLDEIEEILIEADVGVKATLRLIESVKEKARERKLTEGEDVMILLKEEISAILSPEESRTNGPDDPKPVIWMIVGVNGVGKTTTIGKLATYYAGEGEKVIIGACDTFRAAAVEQVAIWAERSGVDIIMSQKGADPANIMFCLGTI